MFQRLQSYFSSFPNIFRAYASHLRREKLPLTLLVLMLVVITVANTAMMWLIGQPVTLISNNDLERLDTVLLMLTAVIFVKFSLHFFYDAMRNAVGLRFICSVRQDFLSQLMYLSFNGVAGFSKGDLLARMSNDIEQLKIIMVEIPLWILSHLMVLVIYVVMLFWIDWRLSLIAMCIAPVFYLLQRILAPIKGKAAEAFFNYNGQLLGFEDQAVSNLHGINSFNAEDQIREKHAAVVESTRFWSLRTLVIDAIYNAGFSWLVFFAAIILIYFGVDAIQAGRIDIGKLVSFLLYLGYLSVPLRGLAQVPLQYQGARGAANRLTEIFSVEPVIKPNLASVNIPNQAHDAGVIELDDMYFGYNDGPSIFRGVSCRIANGETIAIVGPSGSGKTTLANLLLRFFDVDQGEIRINGQDVRDWSATALREQFSVVWQQPFLVNASIRENLQLARRDADPKEMQSACELSQSWEFISAFPQGLDTLIGPGGVVLSAGQCQRLSIAQAFLRDTPFLILDEASSALDSQSEQAIVNALEKLRFGRTTIVIAHRYSSIRTADRVCFLNGDGSIDIGSHDELRSRHKQFRDAVEWQSGR